MSVAPPILPQPRDVSILTTARPLPGDIGFDRWRDGLTFKIGYEARDFAGGVICGDGPGADTTAYNQWVTFNPFFVWQQDGCGEATPQMVTEEIARIRAMFELTLPEALEQQLVSGTYDPASPSLSSVATPLTGAGPHTATGLLNGIALLLERRGNETIGGPTVITGPERAVPWLIEAGVVELRNGVLQGAGWRYLPVRDYAAAVWTDVTTFASSAAAQDPGSATGALTAAAGEAWLFASGVPEYDEFNVMRPSGSEDAPFDADRYWAERMNLGYVLVQRQAIVRFDPKFVYAVKVTIPTT